MHAVNKMGKIMEFYEDLLLSEKIKMTKEEIIERIINEELLFHTYLVVVPLHQIDGQLEMFHVEISRQSFYQQENYMVVGIALGKADAIEMSHKIIKMVYEETGNVEVKQYFISKR